MTIDIKSSVSGCCQASINTDLLVCSDCKDHCGKVDIAECFNCQDDCFSDTWGLVGDLPVCEHCKSNLNI